MADSDLPIDPADRDLAVRTMIGEAGGQDVEGQAAVANVIRNRLAAGSYGKTAGQVVLSKGQFEPWASRKGELLGYDPNSAAYQNAGDVFDSVMSGRIPDITNGATHFYAPKLQSQLGRATPAWAQGQGKLIAGQMYFAPQGPVSRVANAPASQAISAMTQPKAKGQASAAAPQSDFSALKALGVDLGDDAPPAAAAPGAPPRAAAPSASVSQPVAGASQPSGSLDALKALGVDLGDDKPAGTGTGDVTPQQAGKPLMTDPQTGFTVSRNDAGYTSLTDPKTGRIMQQFAPGDYEARASQFGSFAAGAMNIPVAGPAILGGIERVAAAKRAISTDAPYSDALSAVQGDVARDVAVHPWANTAGRLTGTAAALSAAGAIPGVNMLLGGGTGGLAARTALGAGSNALIGGTDAAVRGKNPWWGTLSGFGGGLIGPVAGKLAGNAISGGLNKLTAAVMPSTIPGVGRPAANMLSKVLTADDPAAVQSSLDQLGPFGTLADAGPSFQGLTTGLASAPGEGRSIISRTLEQRGAGRDSRLLGDIDTALGPAESPQAVSDAINAHRSMTDAANYAIVHAQGAPVDVSGVVQSIDAALPTAVGSQRTALNAIRGELVDQPATYDEFGQQVAPETYHDNSELLHNLRQEIDKSINYGDAGLGVPQGAVQRANGSLVMVRGALDRALKDQVPGMAEADAASSALARRAEAVQSGTNLLDSGKTTVTPSDFADQRAAMDPGVAIAQNKGLRGEVDRLVGTKRNDLVALQGALQGEGGWNTSKLSTAFGAEPTNLLTGAVNRESRFAGTEGEALRNSRTDRSAAARQMLDEADPSRIDLKGVTPTGLVLQGAKSAVVDPLLNLLLKQDNAARNGQLANALVAQGPARDAMMSRLVPYAARQNALAAGSQAVGSAAGAGVNLLTRAAAPNGPQNLRALRRTAGY